MGTASLCLGALEAAVELGRERLRTSKPFGIPRIDRVPSRVRWARVYEAARVARLLRDTVTESAIQRARNGRPREVSSRLHWWKQDRHHSTAPGWLIVVEDH